MRKATKTYIDLSSISEFTSFVKRIPLFITGLLLLTNLIFSNEEEICNLDSENSIVPYTITKYDCNLSDVSMSKPDPIIITHMEDNRPMDVKIFGWCQSVGEELDIDPYLIRAVIKVESHDDPDICGDGAVGIMQLIPSCHKTTMDYYGYTIDDLFDPYKNIKVGATYLSKLVHKYEDISYALVCYNKGEGGAQAYGKTTSPYSEYVLSVYNQLKGGDIL